MDAAPQRPSLVDDTEQALRTWLSTGTHRTGDRLPPELELAAMLGVSRGTLRTALDRLADTGEISRRQGSGTYVGKPVRPATFNEGLEVLQPYSVLAERRGVELTVRDVEIAERPLSPEIAEVFGLPSRAPAWCVTRTVLADGVPVAVMSDTIGPGVLISPEKRLQRAVATGSMVLDVLVASGVNVAFAVTHVRPRMITPRGPIGSALGAKEPTAVLELEEIMHLSSGEAVQHASDMFAPGGIDLQVRRNLAVSPPAPSVRGLPPRT